MASPISLWLQEGAPTEEWKERIVEPAQGTKQWSKRPL